MPLRDIEDLLKAAQEHGESAGDTEVEVGDLAEMLRFTWTLLTPSKRDAVLAQFAEMADWLLEQE